MIFEMVCSRGTRVWLDGEKSITRWSYGCEGNTLTSDDLSIGQHQIKSIEVIGSDAGDNYYVFASTIAPKEIELTTDKGKWRGPVAKIVGGREPDDPEADYDKVRLANGEDYEVSEVELYIKAILQPVE